jgi:hypothetical protein
MSGKRNGPVRGSLGNLPEMVFGPLVPAEVSRGDRIAMMQAISKMNGKTHVLSCLPPDEIYCPILAYFDDERDPKTIHVVDPHNLPDVYKGVDIVSMSITIVDDSPDKSGKSLPAFEPNAGWAQWSARLDYNDPRRLGPDAFRRGM